MGKLIEEGKGMLNVKTIAKEYGSGGADIGRKAARLVSLARHKALNPYSRRRATNYLK